MQAARVILDHILQRLHHCDTSSPVIAMCTTGYKTSNGLPINTDLCYPQEVALCIGAQIKEEALVPCSDYLAPCFCLCNGWG